MREGSLKANGDKPTFISIELNFLLVKYVSSAHK